MIALGAEPDTAEVGSITPHYDKLKYPGGKPSSKKRETYELYEYSYKKSVLHGQSTSKSNVFCVHQMSTCNDTQMDIEEVATQNSCCDVGCERLNSVTPILAKRTGDTPHRGGDQISTPTHTFGDSDTLDYVTEPLWPSGVALSVDKIDDGKIDTFAPFLAEKPSQDDLPKGPEDFLNEITFEGDESFQRKLRELCSEYSDIFSDQLAEKSAALKTFEINIPLELWKKDVNRTPVRPQSSTKEAALKENLDEMLASGVIERSDAAYYSHPVIVTKSPGKFSNIHRLPAT